ncbi:MAG TPA: MgtC/SapB family protein [Permianibacter sp.]|nr:MgtC/SapB family protein [Permianibacter sp.]
MELGTDGVLIRDFAIALAIGALVGVEREKHRERSGHGAAGLRSFMLIAELGALAAWLGQQLAAPWLLGVVVIALALISGPLGLRPSQPTSMASEGSRDDAAGITTAVAALVVYLLGALTLYGHAEHAVALAIATSAILAFREPMHGLVRQIGTDDLYAGLKLLIATFIVLPLLPNRTLDPWGAFNPFQLWLLVILISGLSLVGYVAMRWLGPHRGTALTALAGGLVSSTAVTLSFAKRSREQIDASAMLATGVLLAWTVMYLRVLVDVAMVHVPLLQHVAVPMLVLAVLCLVLTVRGWRHARNGHSGNGLPIKNPFSLVSATQFALFFAVILVVVKLSEIYLPPESLYGVAAIAGFAEVDAMVLSLASLVRDGTDAEIATRAILLTTLTNTWTKTGLIIVLASPAMRRPLLVASGVLSAASLLLFLLV